MELDPVKIQEARENLKKRLDSHESYINSIEGMLEIEEKVERLARGLTEEDKNLMYLSKDEWNKRKEATMQKFIEMKKKMHGEDWGT